MKKMICAGILFLGLTTTAVWAEEAMQAQATPGPDQPAATETQPEAQPVKASLDKKTREALRQEKAAQKQAEKVAKQAQKAAQKQEQTTPKEKNPAQPQELAKEKTRPFRGDFKPDFDQRDLRGNIGAALKKYPEFRQIVENELELDAQCRDLVKKFKGEKKQGKKAEFEKQLRDVVNQLFDARQARRMFELKIFEDRIQELRKQTEERNGRKDRIVEKRMLELIGTDEDLRF